MYFSITFALLLLSVSFHSHVFTAMCNDRVIYNISVRLLVSIIKVFISLILRFSLASGWNRALTESVELFIRGAREARLGFILKRTTKSRLNRVAPYATPKSSIAPIRLICSRYVLQIAIKINR